MSYIQKISIYKMEETMYTPFEFFNLPDYLQRKIMIEELDFDSINNLCEAASWSKSEQAILFSQLCADSEVWRSKFQYAFPSYFEGMDRDAANFWKDAYESFGEKARDYEEELVDAVQLRDLSRVKDLLERGVDPNVRRYNPSREAMRLPLLFTSYHNQIEFVKTLLRAGADPDLEDDDGQTALLLASYAGNTEVVEALLQAGADINHISAQGATALYSALAGYERGLADNLDTIFKVIEYNPDLYIRKEGRILVLDKAEKIRNGLVDDEIRREFDGVIDALLQLKGEK